MTDKQIETNANGKQKNTIFEDPNTANSSVQEESQVNSPITNAELNEKFNNLMVKFNSLLDDNVLLKKDNLDFKTRVEILEKKYDALESLVIRNNINVDLLANRDSLKTLLLLFSVNLNVTSIRDIKTISKNSIIKTKFTSLMVSILKNLKDSLEPEPSWRKNDQSQKAENTLSDKKKKEIKDKFIFVECIHFIVCSIDNIVHSTKEQGCDVYSKLIGKRSKENLEKSLIHFFQNPRTIEELNDIIDKNKNRPVESENRKIKEINGNGKKSDEPKDKDVVYNIIKSAKKNDENKKEVDNNTNESINEKRKSETSDIALSEDAALVEKEKEKFKKEEENKGKVDDVPNKKTEDELKKKNKINANIDGTKKDISFDLPKNEIHDNLLNKNKVDDKLINEIFDDKNKECQKLALRSEKIKPSIKIEKHEEVIQKIGEENNNKKERVEKVNSENKGKDNQEINTINPVVAKNKFENEQKVEKEDKKENHPKESIPKDEMKEDQNQNEITEKRKEEEQLKNMDVVQEEKKGEKIDHENKVDKSDENEKDYSNESMETEFTFENYDIPKDVAYKKNKEYYLNLNGKNDYKGEFFIEYLFVPFDPNFEKFSNIQMAINYQEFKDYSDKVIEEFKNKKTGVDPLHLMSKLKWLS